MDFSAFDTPRPDIDADTAELIALEQYGIEGKAQPLAGERDRNFKITAQSDVYALKVGNAGDRLDSLEAQVGAMAHALRRDPGLPIPAVVRTRDDRLTTQHRGHGIQLVSFIEGASPCSMTSMPGLRRSIGTLAGRMSRSLRGYDHPSLHRAFPWNLGRAVELTPLLEFVDPALQPLIEAVLTRMADDVIPQLEGMPKQALHGDLNLDNMVVDLADSERIVGLFDFGDMHYGPRVYELAVAAAYQCSGSEPAAAIAQVASAFHVVQPLESPEIDLLPDLVAARAAQSILMASRSSERHPDNNYYLTGDRGLMIETLQRLAGSDRAESVLRIRKACGAGSVRSRSLEEALDLRRRRLGPALSLSYDDPVRLERGDGVWLYEESGSRLLDAYNNVPHIGHAHPQVVSAVASQTGRLSTNTRYLVDEVAEYADRLAGLLPDPLGVVMFVNSGSEANDLAYQIAATVTGAPGVITTDNAYHGMTLATTAMSPEEYPETAWSSQAARIGGAALLASGSAAEQLGSEMTRASSELSERGTAAGMAIFDTVFSSEGIFELPEGFLRSARDWADANGALLVADEIQAGFGRVGPSFWGFANDSVVPDIVTLGKPMGNGYPMGAVVTTPEIAAEFASKWHFFSTFAGSPVAAAAGDAVLDVIEAEALPQNALAVGEYLRAAVRQLDRPAVVDVRGPGLFIGIELADADSAADVVNRLRRRGILIGRSGPKANVLKIRPPLVFTNQHADIVLAALAEALS